MGAVLGLGRQIAELLEVALKQEERLAHLFVALFGFLIGIEDDDAAIAVDDDLVAAGDVGQEFAQADHGGNLEDAGHDGGMAGPAARLGGEGVHLVAVHRRRFAGRQIVGQDDDRLLQVAQHLAAFAQQDCAGCPFRCRTDRRPGWRTAALLRFSRVLACWRMTLLTAYSAE